MKITVNGKTVEIVEGMDLHRLVHSGKADPGRVILVLNDGVVKSDRWSLTVLSEGDRVELVSFVGGG
ncbi:MAG: sulfur carrier protein ThiS [Syntrophorhabdus sp.]|jgi:sulfur carrier protein|nr:sulfur carrier protein ThiS [Syntrophorhabdus sp.]